VDFLEKLQRLDKNFASSQVGKAVGRLALQTHIRPSDIIESKDSVIERYLLDMDIISATTEEMSVPTSTRGKLEARRRKEWPKEYVS